MISSCLPSWRARRILPPMSASASPRDARPFPFSTAADALQWIEDPVGIVDLIDRRRTLGAVAPAASGMEGIALELADGERVLLHPAQKSAGRLAIETDRGEE